MKMLVAQLVAFGQSKTARRNLRTLLRYLALLVAVIILYSVIFHVLMEAEGQEHSWLTGVYWTLTVMSTLGFGDITFATDLGRAFSVFVLLSGVVFLLVVFPFTFIQFFYQPWLEAQERARAPRELPPNTTGHVLLTGADPVVRSVVDRLIALDRSYAVLVADTARALELADDGVKVMIGATDDAETWVRARVEAAATVIIAADDFLNTNITFTVRELHETVPVVALARSVDSVDVLQLAGSTHVVQLAELLGVSIARRAYGGDSRANVVGALDGLLVAEAPMTHSSLIGQTLGQASITAATGASVVGTWEHGAFALPHAASELNENTVLVLAGLAPQLAAFDRFARGTIADTAPVLILGGGRVGRVVARELSARGLDYRIVDVDPSRAEVCDPERLIVGSAADLATLKRAGVERTPTIVITTHDDALNVYLTIYCRRLRPDTQILARANHDRNVSTLHRAGANLVLSYTSLGASTILALTDPRSALHVAEGLELFRLELPRDFRPASIAECRFREDAGCTIIAIRRDGVPRLAPAATDDLRPGDQLILAGSPTDRRHLIERLASPEPWRSAVAGSFD